MTDMESGMSQSSDTSSSQGMSSPAPAAPQAQSTPEERTFRQTEVTDIVKRAKHDAVETYRRMQTEQPQYLQQKYGDASPQSQPQPVNQPQQQQGIPSEDTYRRIAAEEAQRLRDQWVKDTQAKSQEEMAQRTVQNFWNKVNPGREKYQDFDKVTGDIEYARFPNVVQLLADYVDNSHDVVYELGKDFTKMEILESLASRSPKAAITQIQRLAQSIKDNESAGKARVPNEPLSQLRPSNAGTDNGALSVKDFRKKYRV